MPDSSAAAHLIEGPRTPYLGSASAAMSMHRRALASPAPPGPRSGRRDDRLTNAGQGRTRGVELALTARGFLVDEERVGTVLDDLRVRFQSAMAAFVAAAVVI